MFSLTKKGLLKITHQDELLEAGCDEAGRGCLAGPVFAAAVILPKDFFHSKVNLNSNSETCNLLGFLLNYNNKAYNTQVRYGSFY